LGELSFAQLPSGNYSKYLVANVERLGRLQGVHIFTEILSNRKVSLFTVDAILCIANRTKDYWQTEIITQLSTMLCDCVSARLKNLTEEEIRGVSKGLVNMLLSRLETLLTKVWPKMRVAQFVEQTALDVAHKYFKSKYLDCRVMGLNDLREIIAAVRSMDSYQQRKKSAWTFSLESPPTRAYRWISPDHLIGWLEKYDILEECLGGEHSHSQLLRRTTDIIIFYSQEEKLTPRHLERLWGASRGVHESVETIVYRIVREISDSLPGKLLDHLYNLMRGTQIKDFDEAYLALLAHLTAHGIQLAQSEGRSAWYGIHDFWALMMDDAGVDPEVSSFAEEHFHALITAELGEPLRVQYAVQCCVNIRNGRSVYQALGLLSKLVSSYPQGTRHWYSTANTNTMWGLLEHLQTNHQLLDSFLSDLQMYKQKAVEFARGAPIFERDSLTPVGNVPFIKQIKQRLHLLEFILVNSSLSLSQTQVEMLWDSLVDKMVSTMEGDHVFLLLQRLAGKPGEEAPFGDAFAEGVLEHLFLNRLAKLRMAPLTMRGAECIVHFFLLINRSKKRLKYGLESPSSTGAALFSSSPVSTSTGDDRIVVQRWDGIVGLPALWSIALTSLDEEVGRVAIDLLYILHSSIGSKLKKEQGHIRQTFVKSSLQELIDSAFNPSSPASSPESTNKVQLRLQRSLTMLKLAFLENYDEVPSHALFGGRHGDLLLSMHSLVQVGTPDGSHFQLAVPCIATLGELRRRVGYVRGRELESFELYSQGVHLSMDHDETLLTEVGLVDQCSVFVMDMPAMAREETRLKALEGKSPPPSPSLMKRKVLSGRQARGRRRGKFALPSLGVPAQSFYDHLFQLLNLDRDTAHRIWGLVLLLPVNPKILTFLRELDIPQNGKDGVPRRHLWREYFDRQSTFKLLYALQIVDHIVTIGPIVESKKSITDWCARFVSTGGFECMIDTLLSVKTADRHDPVLNQGCLWLLVKITNVILARDPTCNAEVSPEHSLPAGVLTSSLDFESLFHKALELCMVSASQDLHTRHSSAFTEGPQPSIPNPNSKSTPDLVDVVTGEDHEDAEASAGLIHEMEASQLVAECLHFVQGAVRYDLRYLSILIEKADLALWLHSTILSAKIGAVAWEVVEQLKVLVEIGERLGEQTARNILLEALLSHLDAIVQEPRAGNGPALGLTAMLISMGEEEGEVVPPVDIKLQGMLSCLLERALTCLEAIPPARIEAYEGTVVGLLRVAHAASKHALSAGTSRIEEARRQINRLWGYLYEKPLYSILEWQSASPGILCLSDSARIAASSLLVELSAIGGLAFEESINHVARLVSEMKIAGRGANRRPLWGYNPSLLSRTPGSFAGLQNQGATCYMNSLLQQLFVMPHFVDQVIAAWASLPPEKALNKKSALYQFCALMCHLRADQTKFYDTVPFCEVLTDGEGQPLSFIEQQDANEFFNRLFDKLEEEIAPGKDKQMFKRLFGGTNSNQVICKECGHISERVEPFFSLSLDVRNQRDIETSLSNMIEGEMLNGDNQYACDQCKKKVDAVRRSCLGDLPNYLVVHLKRFEFDFDSMQHVKVNDECKFPHDLDLSPFCKAGLAAIDSGSPIPDLQARYHLAGVLVHTGMVNSGHYYSFISTRNPSKEAWFEFNDTHVHNFDPNKLPEEAFGGISTDPKRGPSGGQKSHSKVNNAYILFYDRVLPSRGRTLSGRELPAELSTPRFFAKMGGPVSRESFDLNDLSLNEGESPSSQRLSESEMAVSPVQGRQEVAVEAFEEQTGEINGHRIEGAEETDADPDVPDGGCAAVVDVREAMWNANMKHWLDKQVFQSDFCSFVWHLSHSSVDPVSTPCSIYEAAWVEGGVEGMEKDLGLGDEAASSYLALRLSTSYVLDVYVHGSDINMLPVWQGMLKQGLVRHVPFATWFILKLLEGDWIKLFLVECPIREVRALVTDLATEAMQLLAVYDKQHAEIGGILCQGREAVAIGTATCLGKGSFGTSPSPKEKDTEEEKREEVPDSPWDEGDISVSTDLDSTVPRRGVDSVDDGSLNAHSTPRVEVSDHRKGHSILLRFVTALIDAIAEEPPPPPKADPAQVGRRRALSYSRIQAQPGRFAEVLRLLRVYAGLTKEAPQVLLQGQGLVGVMCNAACPMMKNEGEAPIHLQPRIHYADCWSELSVLLSLILRDCEVSTTGSPNVMPTMPKTSGSSLQAFKIPHDVMGGFLPLRFLLQIMRYSSNANAVVELAVHLCWENAECSYTFSDILVKAFGEHLDPGPATKQIQILLEILASFMEMRDSISRKRALTLLDAAFGLLERFGNSRRQSNARYVSKAEINAIAEAGGMLIRTAKESPFPYVQDWLASRKEAWTLWQKQMKKEMQKLGISSSSSGWLDVGSYFSKD